MPSDQALLAPPDPLTLSSRSPYKKAHLQDVDYDEEQKRLHRRYLSEKCPLRSLDLRAEAIQQRYESHCDMIDAERDKRIHEIHTEKGQFRQVGYTGRGTLGRSTVGPPPYHAWMDDHTSAQTRT